MSFKLARFFYLVGSFVIGFFFFVIGIFSILLPWSPLLKSLSIQFLLEKTLVLSLFGLGLTLTGLSIVIYTLLRSRRKYVTIRTGEHAVTLDENVVRQYLENYWQEQFPQFQIPFHLNFKKDLSKLLPTFLFFPFRNKKHVLKKSTMISAIYLGVYLGILTMSTSLLVFTQKNSINLGFSIFLCQFFPIFLHWWR